MSEPMSPLDRRLLDALRADRPAPRDARDRARARLEAAIPEMRRGPDGGGGDGGGTGGAPGGGVRWFGPRSAIGLTGFVAGGITGAAVFAALAGSPSPRIVYVDRPASLAVAPAASPAPTVEARSAAPAPTEMQRPEEARAVVATPSTSAPTGATRPASVHHTSRLSEERVLLDEARAGLVQGDPARALERLDLHLARFADGQLAEEREAMQVEALVRVGRYDEARDRARAFRARSSGSLFMPTVESAIASIP